MYDIHKPDLQNIIQKKEQNSFRTNTDIQRSFFDSSTDHNGTNFVNIYAYDQYEQLRVGPDAVHRCVRHQDLQELMKLSSELPASGNNLYRLAQNFDAEGFTALHYAAAMNRIGMLSFLLDGTGGIQIDLENREGETLLQVAIR